MTTTEYEVLQARMTKAFALVQPQDPLEGRH
jgi:hypothetical protein